MSNPLPIMGIRINDGSDETFLMPIDSIRLADRPAAFGYFLLNVIQEAHRKRGRMPDVTVRFGRVPAGRLAAERRERNNVYTPVNNAAEFAELFSLICAVEHGNKDILEDGPDEGFGTC